MPVVLRRRLAVLVAAVLLAAPAPALAQSAGDDQYEDPFAGENQSQQESGGGGQEPTPTPAPAEPAPAAPAPAPAAESPPAAAPAQQPELPRTGLDAAPILAIGAVLLGSGVALRVRLRERA